MRSLGVDGVSSTAEGEGYHHLVGHAVEARGLAQLLQRVALLVGRRHVAADLVGREAEALQLHLMVRRERRGEMAVEAEMVWRRRRWRWR